MYWAPNSSPRLARRRSLDAPSTSFAAAGESTTGSCDIDYSLTLTEARSLFCTLLSGLGRLLGKEAEAAPAGAQIKALNPFPREAP